MQVKISYITVGALSTGLSVILFPLFFPGAKIWVLVQMSKLQTNAFTLLRIGTLAPHGRRPQFMQSIVQDLHINTFIILVPHFLHILVAGWGNI